MNYCGLDLGKKSSNFCIMNEKKEILHEKVVSNKAHLIIRKFSQKEFGELKIVIEASGKSFWLADLPRESGTHSHSSGSWAYQGHRQQSYKK